MIHLPTPSAPTVGFTEATFTGREESRVVEVCVGLVLFFPSSSSEVVTAEISATNGAKACEPLHTL